MNLKKYWREKETSYQTKVKHIGKKEQLISWNITKQEINISPEVWDIEESIGENV